MRLFPILPAVLVAVCAVSLAQESASTKPSDDISGLRDKLDAANAAVAGGGAVFPVGAGVLNVKAFGAKGDGLADDTDALQAAYNRTGLIYLPNGTYRITRQIKAPARRGSAACRRIVQGQSTDGVIIQLADNAEGFGDPAKPRSMFITSWGVAQAFRNAVYNVTFDCGKGNAGAVGLEFFASNQGGVYDVVIRSGDGAGHAGLLLKGDNGPMFIKNLRVVGFDTGISASANQLATLEHIRIEGQRVCGVSCGNKTFIRDLVSRNKVVALRSKSQGILVRDSQFLGGAGGAAAEIAGMACVRNLTVEGYESAIRFKDQTVAGPTVKLWTNSPVLAVGGDSGEALDLPVQEPPAIAWDAPPGWASVKQFEPETVTIQNKGTWKKTNWAAAVQKAIDSGATTVYFPAGMQYDLSGTIHVRGKVRRIIGCESELRPVATLGGVTFIVEDGPSPVVIERFDSIYGKVTIEHRSTRPLVVKDIVVDEITLAKGAGDVFLEDIYSNFLVTNGGRVWARGLNMEHSYDEAKEPQPRPNALNAGGLLWVLGLKTEQNRTKVVTTAGGRSEVAAYILANRASNPLPMFATEDASLTLTVAESVGRKAPYGVVIRQTRGGKSVDLTHEQAPRGGEGCAIPLANSVMK